MRVTIPEPALVLLIGPSGAGKSTFAAAHFRPTEIISSDALRGMLTDDPSDQGASAEAFRVLALLANGRLKRRLMTVIDATNLRAANRKRYRALAARYGIPVVTIAFDLPAELFAMHNERRPDRVVDGEVLAAQTERMVEAMTDLASEEYEALYVIRDAETMSATTVDRRPVRA
ncbi:MAG: AAA family ATPase [Chloroflexota bacterium]